ncbi:heterokaryon incompatibility protein-domain-containing protein [Bisporella sp. PMI_857]|nr:heterokaryon incompatibility protein-domain-containing protein [Bisporella sp. PMI_857]
MRKRASASFYNSLDRSKFQIRLFKLFPSSSHQLKAHASPTEDLIEGELVLANLSENPVYEALSYEWGPKNGPGASFSVRINGEVRQVRENLWWALHYLREETTRTIWIDALCINQSSIKERNHQVQFMGDIYRQAANVVIWLGREHEDLGDNFPSDAETFRLIRRLHELDTDDNIDSKKIPSQFWSDRTMMGVYALLLRSYWYRAWIMQEVVLASKKSIRCGPLVIRWDELCCIYNSQPLYHGEVYNYVMASLPFKLLQMEKMNTTSKYALDLILDFYMATCQNPSDKIFATRNLVRPCCREAVPVDYSRSTSAAVKRLVKHHLDEHSYESTYTQMNIEAVVRTFNIDLNPRMGLRVDFSYEDGISIWTQSSHNRHGKCVIRGRGAVLMFDVIAWLNRCASALNPFSPKVVRFGEVELFDSSGKVNIQGLDNIKRYLGVTEYMWKRLLEVPEEMDSWVEDVEPKKS